VVLVRVGVKAAPNRSVTAPLPKSILVASAAPRVGVTSVGEVERTAPLEPVLAAPNSVSTIAATVASSSTVAAAAEMPEMVDVVWSPVLLPESVRPLSLISLPVVPSKNTTRLSTADAGPFTSPPPALDVAPNRPSTSAMRLLLANGFDPPSSGFILIGNPSASSKTKTLL
jgi:hypothetical protein